MLLNAVLTFLLIFVSLTNGMLYPRGSESRQIQELDGMWNFRADTSPSRNVGMVDKWFEKQLAKVRYYLKSKQLSLNNLSMYKYNLTYNLSKHTYIAVEYN